MPDAPADTATTDSTTEATTDDANSTDTGEDTTDWKAEAEKFKALARKHEDRAKANATAAKELEEAKRQGMTELEAAVDRAKSDARAETLREFGGKLIHAEVRSLVAGRDVDVDALLEGRDLSGFLDADGDPDRAAIAAWVDKVAPAPAADDTRFPDLGQGTRTGDAMALNGDPLTKMLSRAVGAPRR